MYQCLGYIITFTGMMIQALTAYIIVALIIASGNPYYKYVTTA